MDSNLTLLKNQAGISTLDINKCIISQKSQWTKLTSTKNGRFKVIEAAHIRKDMKTLNQTKPTYVT